MSSEFESDLSGARSLIETGRQQLLKVVDDLGPTDLDRGLRGGWDVRGVLKHIIDSEHHYASMVGRLRGASPAATPPTADLSSPATVRQALEQSRLALLAALEGVDEETFYRMAGGSSDYSVLSALENVHHHDEEHRSQIERIIRGAAAD